MASCESTCNALPNFHGGRIRHTEDDRHRHTGKKKTRRTAGDVIDKEAQLSKIIDSFTEEESTFSSSIADHSLFKAAMTMATLLNMLQMGVEADHPEWDGWLIVENTFAAIFTIEMVVKLLALRRNYFADKANLLDGALAVLGALDCWVLNPLFGGDSTLQTLSILRILRLARLARLLRLVQRVRPLILVLQGVLAALSTSIYVLLVSAIVIYVFAVFLTQTLGKPDINTYPGYATDAEVIDGNDFMMDYNPHVYFGNMLASMVTLFNIATFTEWAEIVRPIVLKQPLYLPVFLLFVTLVGFGLMNVLIGVIVEGVIEESKRVEEEYAESLKHQKLAMLDRIQTMLLEMDKDSDGIIDLVELSDALKENKLLMNMVAHLRLPTGWSAKELLEMLDRSGDGVLNHAEFTTSFFRLLDSNEFQKRCIMHADINQLKALLQDQNKTFGAALSSIQHDVDAIKSVLGVHSNFHSEEATVQTSIELLGRSARDHMANAHHHSQEKYKEDQRGFMERIELVVKECMHDEFSAFKNNLRPEMWSCPTPQPRVVDSDDDDSGAASRMKRKLPHHALPLGAPTQRPGDPRGDDLESKVGSMSSTKFSQPSQDRDVVSVEKQTSLQTKEVLTNTHLKL